MLWKYHSKTKCADISITASRHALANFVLFRKLRCCTWDNIYGQSSTHSIHTGGAPQVIWISSCLPFSQLAHVANDNPLKWRACSRPLASVNLLSRWHIREINFSPYTEFDMIIKYRRERCMRSKFKAKSIHRWTTELLCENAGVSARIENDAKMLYVMLDDDDRYIYLSLSARPRGPFMRRLHVLTVKKN